ncbi:hypothetical protein FEM48_Zijuj06G0161800 [Ziziphus jujuba var. spinosa]|uniref:Uncharacterized protein n=1 Tax=Ziziphus jujuba var. spinosa TaxID=714518 RepID=A0A978VAA6_ZIZJJ|nr:hypothetical protein FEM48_Zijuj06G0161800 [Ziziphus jujuba var. spinosa]
MLSFSGHVYHIKCHVNTPVVFRKCFLNHWNVVEDIHYRNREEYGRTDIMKVGLSYRSKYGFVFLSNCLLLDSILPSSSYRSPFLCCFKFQRFVGEESSSKAQSSSSSTKRYNLAQLTSSVSTSAASI